MSEHTSVSTTETQPSETTIKLRQQTSSTDPDAKPPPPPIPSSDPRLTIAADQAAKAKSEDGDDLFKLAPSEALRMLSSSVEHLVRMTGDIPPTPPPKSPSVPHMSGLQAEKESMRSHSEKNLARLRQQAELEAKRAAEAAAAAAKSPPEMVHPGMNQMPVQQSEPIDGVRLKQPTAPMSPPAEPEPYIVVGADSQPLNLQHGAITRKFYSKNEPPITINQYLLRLHQFCPMSTAVYLATSLYIHRLAVEERAIPVTRRNAHRLVLAGLRVAMKALEDLSYPHSKMARVGGVSEAELARLEISFCFLAGFELVVDMEGLQNHCAAIKAGRAETILNDLDMPTLRLNRKRRQVAQAGE